MPDWMQHMIEDPTFWNVVSGILVAILGIAGYVLKRNADVRLTKAEAERDELKTKYADMQSDNARQDAILKILERTLTAGEKRDEQHRESILAYNRSTDAFREKMTEQNQALLAVAESTSAINQAHQDWQQTALNEFQSTRTAVEKSAQSTQTTMDDLLTAVKELADSLIKSDAEVVEHTEKTAAQMQANARLIAEMSKVIHRLQDWLDKHATDELNRINHDKL